MTTVLFACIHNAGRSQMAAAFFNARADPAKARAISTGTEPGDSVHPEVVDAMREVGMDLSATHPRRLTPELLVELATRLQLDTDEMATAIDVQRYLDRITRDVEGGERAGVHSTPTFFINGQLYSGAWDFENLLQALDAA